MPCAGFPTCLDDELTSSSNVGSCTQNDAGDVHCAMQSLAPLCVAAPREGHPLLRDSFPLDDEFSLPIFPPFFTGNESEFRASPILVKGKNIQAGLPATSQEAVGEALENAEGRGG